jgi:hypothetical protein
MTLSHCWGTAEVTKLLKSNLESMCQLVPLDSLPRTFQDAIAITKRFGVRYLWIDSLCIIQDSVEDWRQESALMGEVYKNSFLNVAAAGAADGTEGCFFRRNPASLQLSRVELVRELFLPRRDVKGVTHPYYLLYHRPSWKDMLEEAKLNRRAWIVQERILSPRVLHFDRQQLFWECRELEACEAYPGGTPKIPYHPVLNLKIAIPMQGSDFFQEGQATDAVRPNRADPFLNYWGSIVELYCRGLLTMSGDKLVALSGIADEAQELLKDDYLAGLWRRTLLEELIWVADDEHPGSSLRFRPNEYRAPSWSWASLEGRVSYYECLPSSHESGCHWASVVDAQVTPISSKTGQVSGGLLKISGRLGLLRWAQDADTSRGRTFRILEVKSSVPDSGSQGAHSKSRSFGHKSVRFDEFDQANPHPEVLFCLTIFCSQETTRNVDPVMFGLLLSRTEQGEYKRVGRFDAMDENTVLDFASFPKVTITII